jgi:hypothetical protein
VEYLTICRPYKLPLLIENARKEGNLAEYETKNWNTLLNNYAEKKYRVINSGVIVFGGEALFWAMLERPDNFGQAPHVAGF